MKEIKSYHYKTDINLTTGRKKISINLTKKRTKPVISYTKSLRQVMPCPLVRGNVSHGWKELKT